MRIRTRVKKFVFRHVPRFVGAYPYFGVKVWYPPRAWIIDIACEQGIFERASMAIIARLVRPGSCYYDIGANLGFLSIPALHRNPDIQVVSFEPSPSYLPYLARTAKESIYADRWRVVGHAVGATVGNIEFSVGSVKVYDDMIANETYRSRATQTVLVPVTTIDEFWRSSGRPDVSVIKIDTEGAEFQALRGAVECLQECRPLLHVEFSEPHLRAFEHTPEEIFDWISTHGYSIASLPHIVPVKSSSQFRVHLLSEYNFLLLPDHLHRPSCVLEGTN